ncbi:MAG: MBL fold metallo-hydrolase [Candidatus Riflebacteria bacterium]|jgi:glyoxylase-like metal-dependent hydrolase (beta-lactamase superfamily II)|nr:MBL fold metallo-hydrolase [Candidatus Riflebacteria bacterium]
MKVIQLQQHCEKYSCRSYLVLGNWNALDDVNTLIDPGIDATVISQIEKVYTGVGKSPVDLIILTHNHFDHAGGAAEAKKFFKAKMMAFSPGEGVDHVFKDGDKIRLGDSIFEVIHLPSHSDDSVCFYASREQVIFTGDNTLRVRNSEGSYTPGYLEFLRRMARSGVKVAYGGHDLPIEEGLEAVIIESIAHVEKALGVV